MKLKTEDIEKAAKLHLEGIEDDIELTFFECDFYNGEMEDVHEFITDAFKTGATWGAWKATKNLWHDVSEEPSRYDGYLVKTKQGCIDSAFFGIDGWYEPKFCGGQVKQWLDYADILPQKD